MGTPGPAQGDRAPLVCCPHTLHHRPHTDLSDDGLSASVAAKGRSKDDDLGERGVPAGLQLGVVGDCGASHWTIGGRVWLGLGDEAEGGGVCRRLRNTKFRTSHSHMAAMIAPFSLGKS